MINIRMNDFCFTNLDFLAEQLAHLDFCLITLFAIVTFFEPMSFVKLLHFKQYVSMFYNNVNNFYYSLNNKFSCLIRMCVIFFYSLNKKFAFF